MQRPIVRLSLLTAACLAVAIVWLLVPGQQSTAEAFHKFATAIVEAKTAKFETELKVEGQPEQKFTAYYLAPSRFRQELPGNMINIADWNAGKIVSLNTTLKTAAVMKFKGGDQKKGSMDLFERMRKLLAEQADDKEHNYERLGEKQIDGQPAVGFRLDSPAGMITLWGNPKTGRPVRLETVYSGVPRTEVAMTDFDLNVNLDDALFDLTPPAGYKVTSFEVDASPFTEADLLRSLKLTSDMNDGKFPDSLDTMSAQKAVISFMTKQKEQGQGKEKKQGQDKPEEFTQEMMQTAMNIGRGFNFALTLPASADAHYAGKGVSRGTADTPIFWYKPEGKDTYRVVDADLTTHEVDRAPQVSGAVRIEKAGKPETPAEQ